MNNLIVFINGEWERFNATNSHHEKSEIIFNIINININYYPDEDNYKSIKLFVNHYFKSINIQNYGYDVCNNDKIVDLINTLSYEKQISLYQYVISKSAEILPEYDRDWILEKKHLAEMNFIFASNKWLNYPKGVLLYLNTSLSKLIISLFVLFIFILIVLLPAPFKFLEIINVDFNIYSNNYLFNHLMNTFVNLFDLDDNVKVVPLNWKGVLIMMFGKILFWIFVINFIIGKILDRITIK